MKQNNVTWLICLQTTYNCIKYQTSDGVIKYPRYTDFLDLMMKSQIKDPQNFKKALDSFKVIFIDSKTGDWKLVEKERKTDLSFEEMCSLNIVEEEENTMQSMINKGKRFLFQKSSKNYKK